MEQGLLSGALSPERVFKDGDSRDQPAFCGGEYPQDQCDGCGVEAFCREVQGNSRAGHHCPDRLSQRGITHVLVGARDAVQAKENAKAGYLEFEAGDLKAMNAIAEKLTALAPQGPARPY